MKVKGTFIFTDIVGSSKLWKKFNEEMGRALQEHEDRMYSIVNSYGGVVVKTIGDAFMVFFEGNDSVKRAIICAIEIQRDLTINRPIILRGSEAAQLKVRLGMCTGEAEKTDITTQRIVKKMFSFCNNIKSVNVKDVKFTDGKHIYIEETVIDDYIGNVVNIASRMESKVSSPGSIAFSFYGSKIPEKFIDNIVRMGEVGRLHNSGFTISGKEYRSNCPKKGFFNKRSARLLNYKCADINELHGVPEVTAFNIVFDKR